jgi:excisionase family DNA binding protein
MNKTRGRPLPADAREYLTDKQAADLLGLSWRTIQEWRMKRGLPYIRLSPTLVRIRRADLERWLNGLNEKRMDYGL